MDFISLYPNTLGRIHDIAGGEVAAMYFFIQGEIGEEARE